VKRIALALALLGCGACGCGTGFASTASDYGAYRATRVLPTLEERLAAAHRYLKARPSGAFHAEVDAWFLRAEAAYWASKKGSRTGLAAYFEALPKGPHGDEAARRIVELDTVSKSSQMDRLAAEVEARVSGPGAVGRTRFRRELDAWLARFLDPSVFGAPVSTAKAGLVIPWSLSLPAQRCTLLDPPERGASRRCTKLLELPYEVFGAAGPEPREATLEITVLEDALGAPLEVTFSGPELFLRLEETYRIKPTSAEDRAAAGVRAAAFVQRAFSKDVSPEADCVQPAQPPAALRLACQGVQVEVFPTALPGEDDLVVIVPVRRRSAR
jgi:hypothetical protein